MSWPSKLSLDVIEDYFGASTRAVADALVALGPSSLAEIARFLAASPGFLGAEHSIRTRVRAGLLTLISFDTIEMSASVEEDAGESAAAAPSATATAGTMRYEFRPVAALRIIRAPHYFSVARRGFAEPGVAIAQTLLMRGIWTKPALLAEAARALIREESRALESAGLMDAGAGADAGAADGASGEGRRRRMSSTSSSGAERAAALARVSATWDAMIAVRSCSPSPPHVSSREGIKLFTLTRPHPNLALFQASLIVPHAGLSNFPDFLSASSAAGASSSSRSAGASSAPVDVGGARSAKLRKRKSATAPDSDDDEDEDAVLAAGAGLDGDGARRVLWRFGWEAANRRLRDVAIARFLASAISTKEGD